MVELWRAAPRLPAQRGKREARVIAYPYEVSGPQQHGLGSLRLFHLPPRSRVPRHPYAGAELVMYVREGAVAQEDATGRLDIIRAGEYARLTDGAGMRWIATNASCTAWACVFEICLGNAPASIEPGCEKKRFYAAERRNHLRVVASPDARGGSLRVHRNAIICSAMFSRGRHVVYELLPATCAWLHVVEGELTLRDEVLTRGDGVGVVAERAVSFTAREDSEVLLLHLVERNLWFPPRRDLSGRRGPTSR